MLHVRTPPNTIYKIYSKWIKYLNVRSETIKLLEKNIGSTLLDINDSKILCGPYPRVMEIKAKISKKGLVKSFCTAKGNNEQY